MSKSKKDDKMIMPKASTPWKLMIAYVWCMMFSNVLNLFLVHLNDHNQNKERANTFDGMDRPLVKMQMIEE
jgi:hypothetical protein